jgi:hypothetical protein
MARLSQIPMLLVLVLHGIAHSQNAPLPAAGNSRIYILLKPILADPGAARDAFSQRMAALGALNLQFVSGANAARCEAPSVAQPLIAADQDVSAVLPIDSAAAPAPPTAPQAPVFSTPPYMPGPQAMPFPSAAPMGGGMSAGMALLTDLAGSMVVKLLSPAASCKIRLAGEPVVISSAGGTGAFEVKASGNCAWMATSTADWLQLKTEAKASGAVAITFTATPNTGGPRQAVVVIQAVAGMPQLKGHTVLVVRQ